MSSEEARLVEEAVEAPARCFNPRAFKVVCVTLLTGLLLACLAFMLCALYKQRLQIHDLQRTSEMMDRYLEQQKKDAVFERKVPMVKSPFMDFGFPDFLATTAATVAPLDAEDKASLDGLQKELEQFSDASQLNLQDLRNQMKQSSWKSLESWLNNWLVFQKARQQKQEVRTTTRAPLPDSKCLQERHNATLLIGSYRPQCESWGGYKPVQCWPATRLCWCVDQSGATINGTARIGRPICPYQYGSGLRH